MTDINNMDDKKLEAAVKRFEKFPWEETHSANQEAFETFTAALRNGLRGEVGSIVKGLGEMSFDDANALMVIIGFGAVREGARVFASFTGGLGTKEPPRQVDYDVMMESATALGNSFSPELRKKLEEMPELNWLLSSVELTLNQGLMKRFPALVPQKEEIGSLVLAGVLHGVRLEYLFPKLMEEAQQEDSLKSRLAKDLEPKDQSEAAVLKRWRQIDGKREDIRPWPMDGMCLCGESLEDHAGCCDENAPIDAEELKKNAGANYLLPRPCCSANLTGIRCGECARYYTWTKGVVESVGR